MKKYIIKPIHYAFLGLMALTLSFGAFANVIAPSDIGGLIKAPDGKFYKLRGTDENPYTRMIGVINWPAFYEYGQLKFPLNFDRRRPVHYVDLPDSPLKAALDKEAGKFMRKIGKISDRALFNTSHKIRLPHPINRDVILYIDDKGDLLAKRIAGTNVEVHVEDDKVYVINPLTGKKEYMEILGHENGQSKKLTELPRTIEGYFELYNKYIIDPYNAAHHKAGGHAHRAHHAGHHHHDDHHGGGGGGH